MLRCPGPEARHQLRDVRFAQPLPYRHLAATMTARTHPRLVRLIASLSVCPDVALSSQPYVVVVLVDKMPWRMRRPATSTPAAMHLNYGGLVVDPVKLGDDRQFL